MESIILNISNKTSDGIDAKNILLVDDEDCTIFSLNSLLMSQGYNVTIARNMKKVVNFYKANDKAIDLILMDISIPIIDGLEAIIELKQFDPDVPFLVMSSYSKESLGGVEEENYIRKPFNSYDLFKSIVNLFDVSVPASNVLQ